MFPSSRRRGALLALAGITALALATAGCEEDTVPVITKLSVTPQCGVIADVPPGEFGNTTQDTLHYLEVQFFARASSGNQVSDPTGANSALEWRWDLDGNGSVDVTNVVNPKFRYTAPGDYTARLEVEDDNGDKVSKTVVVQVREEATELDAITIVAAGDAQFRYVVTPPFNNSLDPDGEEIPIEDLPLEERFVFESQAAIAGWNAIFDGQLEIGCSVTELFSQFDWVWDLSTGAQVNDLNPVQVQRTSASFAEVGGRVTVRELVTGVVRSDSTAVGPPLGVRVANGTYQTIAPGAADDIKIWGLMLQGVTTLSFGIEYDPDFLTLEAVDAQKALADAGFTVQVEQTSGRVDFSFSSGTPLGDATAELELATLTFRTSTGIELENPRQRAMRVRDLEGRRGDVVPLLRHRDGFIRQDVADCNSNGLGDTMELTARGTFIDITGDGIIDFCDDCDNSGSPDGIELAAAPLRDIDANRLLDDCDCNSNGAFDLNEIGRDPTIDSDGNGEPDDCDCDWNGQRDLTEIQEHPSFAPVFDPQSGLVIDYASDLDQFGGVSDAKLDFCQDCDDDGILDADEFTLLPDQPLFEVLAFFKLDIDKNQKLDTCDCDGSDQYDRGELERQANGGPVVDSDGDGRIDSCDCDESGVLDIVEISEGLLTVDDLVITVRPGSAPVVAGYRSNVDVNGDLQLDRCADCNGNDQLDGLDIAADLKLDIDVNGLPDTCDCDSNDQYDSPPTPGQDSNGDGINDRCDCDLNSVADLRQIALDPSTLLVFSGSVVIGYTSDVDEITVGSDDLMTISAGPDLVPDLCQDCDGNNVADAFENSVDFDRRRPKDLDRNDRLDGCDCNGNRVYDTTEIATNPALDGNGDEIIDTCDCNNDGQIDLVQMGAIATFDQRNVYTGSALDTNANLILDTCEGAAQLAPGATTPQRAERR